MTASLPTVLDLGDPETGVVMEGWLKPDNTYGCRLRATDTFMQKLTEAQQNKDTPTDKNNRPCMHMLCPRCRGSGLKPDGSPCIHSISCPCNKCTPWA